MSSPSVVEDFEMFTSGVGQNRAALSLNSLFRAADQESPRKGSSARPHTFRKHIVGYCMAVLARSEERRVGKECRCGWSRKHLNKEYHTCKYSHSNSKQDSYARNAVSPT